MRADERLVVGVFGHYADANHGDDACAQAVMRYFGGITPPAEIVLFCRFPATARAKYALPAHPVRRIRSEAEASWTVEPARAAEPVPPGADAGRSGWRARLRRVPGLRALVRGVRAALRGARALPAECGFLWRSYRRLRGVDLLVVAGSSPVFDYFGGFWAYPYTMFVWTVLTRLTGTRLAYVSVGAGPIRSDRSGRLLAWTLRRAHYVSFRDHGSEHLMRRYGCASAVIVPDLAHSLPAATPRRHAAGPLRVGINAMIVNHGIFWPESDSDSYTSYVRALARFAAELRREGHQIFLYGTQKDDRVSAAAVQAVMRQERAGEPAPEYIFPDSVEALIELSASADLLVTTRFHAALFGIANARPTLAICYQGKTRELMETAGVGDFAVAFGDVSVRGLCDGVARLRARRGEIEARLHAYGALARARLQEQFEHLEMLGDPSARPARAGRADARLQLLQPQR